jgi:hypothetical protein
LDRLPGDAPPQLRHVRIEYGGARSIIHELPVATRFHEPSARQLLQVVRNRCLADGKTPAKPPTPYLRLLRDVLENLEATRIGQRFRDALKLLAVHATLSGAA